MAENQVQTGNPEIPEMIHHGQFDRLRAGEILSGVDLNCPITATCRLICVSEVFYGGQDVKGFAA